MHSIVFLDRATLAPGVRVRRPAFEHRWTEFERSEPADLPERLAGATIVIDNKVALRREALRQLPELKLVAVAATGTDCVYKDWCREHGIVVSNVRGYASHTVPEHVFGLILALRRNLCAYRDEVRRGAWQAARQFCFFSHPIQDLHGSNLGIIGEGALGQGVAQLARAFGIPAFTVERRDEVPGAIERLLNEPGPLFCHVKIDPRANVWPLVPPGKSNGQMMGCAA